MEPEKAIHEIGRIYDAITDKSVLIGFFLQTVIQFIPSQKAYLFLAGPDKRLWLEEAILGPKEASPQLLQSVQQAFDKGKPSVQKGMLFLPMIARNMSIGVACFERDGDFTPKELEMGFDFVSEFSGALKNILLFEENIRMERLAAIGQTMAMLVHEIKNILQLAKFSDEMIRMGIHEKNEKFLTRGIEKLGKTLKDMDGFIGEITSLSKDYQLEPEVVSIPALIEELKNDLSERAEAVSVKLEFSTEEDFPEVQGDSRALYRAILNLVKNAFEAFKNKPDACIKVFARLVDSERYEVSVQDNGAGMPDEVKVRLFETFFSTKGKRGTGLGLMVVSRTVNMHRGTVAVESQPGVGTKFTLTLPRIFEKTE
ncbi:MAG TPA: HAMP domain-containing sensor histidine kinase [Candidatus Omnitrophota bacterium]|nr:HAMP domain-containing sensor histidine kinase [Candidatus Omnitrophota bacterium]HQB12021.1 HAMP domain-containing sensor histidine kinase [Candidatus Omnitrophota bacterium]